MTERYFYESFDGLGAFRAALVELVGGETQAVIVRAIDAVPGPPAATLRAVVEAVWSLLTGDLRRGRVAAMEGLADADLQARRQEIIAGFEAVIMAHSAEVFGIEPDDPTGPMVAAAFVGAADEVFLRLLNGAIDTPVQRSADFLVALFAGGVTEAVRRLATD